MGIIRNLLHSTLFLGESDCIGQQLDGNSFVLNAKITFEHLNTDPDWEILELYLVWSKHIKLQGCTIILEKYSSRIPRFL